MSLSAKVYVSSTATAEEIAVFEAKDSAAASRLETIVNTRVQEQKDIYADYAPLEVSRLEKAVIRKKAIICFSVWQQIKIRLNPKLTPY